MPKGFRINSTDFKIQMEQKASKWGPFSLHIGKDFAVFEFHFGHERDDALESIFYYIQHYNYSIHQDNQERLCIINKAGS